MGGQQPVTAATVQLYSVGTASDGSSSTLLYTTTSGATGSFTLTGHYSCATPTTLVYIIASGGNPGLSPSNTNNSGIVLMNALGQCQNLNSSTYININEVSTVAAIAALAPYITSPSAIGSGTSDATAFANAFTLASQLSTLLGVSPGNNVPANSAVPIANINTFANILSTCVNSAGGSAGDGTSCGNLYNDTITSTTPANVFQAALNIINTPNNNVSTLFGLCPSAASPFQPQLTAAPSNWSIALTTSGPYTNYTSYYLLPYTGSPTLKSLGTNLLHVSSYVGDPSYTGNTYTVSSFILDTGSTGVVMPATEVAGYTAGSGTPGSITYSSSGLVLTGYWTTGIMYFPNAVNQSGATKTASATIPILAVTSGSCNGTGVNSMNCTGTIPHMIGIGFGRATTTYGSPAYNAFVNLNEMVAGTMRRGYTFTQSGLQVGLTNATAPLASPFGVATSNAYIGEQLTASNAFTSTGYNDDWNIATGSFIYNGTATATGSVLFDTGLTDMILENVNVASGTTVPASTPITINAIPNLISYSFASGDNNPGTPSSVTWATYSHGPYVNVGNHFLGKYDYLYDADGGILALRPVSR